MEDGIRTRIAFVAYCLMTGKQPNTVYDHHNGQFVNISGRVGSKKVELYDHNHGVHFTSTKDGFYDHEKGTHITMEVKKREVNGYEHESGSHFSGKLKDSTLTLHDQSTSAHFHYIF